MSRRWRLVAVAALGLLAVAVAAPLGSSGVRDVAAQYQAPPDASAYQQRISPRRLVCLGADPCPSLFHSWTVPRRLDRSELEDLVTSPGWRLRVEADCVPDPNTVARVRLCGADGEVYGYAVNVTQLGGTDTEATVLTLSVSAPR